VVAKNEDQAHYFANVANVDAAVGRLVDGLDRMNRRENTLILFTSDNGPETLKRYGGANRSYGTPGPLRGMKLHTTDAGFRVVGIANWKGQIEPGQTIDTPVSSLDFLPTCCHLAKTDLPEVTLDGTNMLPALQGEPIRREKPLLWAYFNSLNKHRVAMRDGNYKVLAQLSNVKKLTNITRELLPSVRDAKLTDLEIYDVTVDIDESENLAKQNAPLANEMRAKLEKAYRELVTTSHVW
jgi:arylsulfatase A